MSQKTRARHTKGRAPRPQPGRVCGEILGSGLCVLVRQNEPNLVLLRRPGHVLLGIEAPRSRKGWRALMVESGPGAVLWTRMPIRSMLRICAQTGVLETRHG